MSDNGGNKRDDQHQLNSISDLMSNQSGEYSINSKNVHSSFVKVSSHTIKSPHVRIITKAPTNQIQQKPIIPEVQKIETISETKQNSNFSQNPYSAPPPQQNGYFKSQPNILEREINKATFYPISTKLNSQTQPLPPPPPPLLPPSPFLQTKMPVQNHPQPIPQISIQSFSQSSQKLPSQSTQQQKQRKPSSITNISPQISPQHFVQPQIIQHHPQPQINFISKPQPQTIPQIYQTSHIISPPSYPQPQFFPLPTPMTLPTQQNSPYIPQQRQQPIPQITETKPRIPIPSPVINKNPTNNVLVPPPPIYCTDPVRGSYGIRCVCGKGKEDCLMVYCELCGFWLHGHCVNVARTSERLSYYCPFCRGQKIRCKCGEDSNYSLPIIQCSVCKLWVHKECENIEYGVIPNNFVCSFCLAKQRREPQQGDEYSLPEQAQQRLTRETKKYYETPFYMLRPSDLSFPISEVTASNRMEIVSEIPNGLFKNMMMSDMNKPEASFYSLVSKYFHHFVSYFFERNIEFWKVFTDTFSELFCVDKNVVLKAVDFLAFKLLYKTPYSVTANSEYPHVDGLVNSESITQYLSTMNCPKLNEMPKPVILTQLRDGRIVSSQPIDDGQFITELTGFLMHTDEVNCDSGIPPCCLTVTNKDLVIDLSVSNMAYAAKIKRSFWFNCIVKLVRVGGDIRCALYAVRENNPLFDEKNKRGPVINSDQELVLPLDSFLPYPVEKREWKEKRSRSKASSAQTSQKISRQHSVENIAKERKSPKPKKEQEKKQSAPKEIPVKLSLLSGFTYDIIPPLPFILTDEKDKEKSADAKKQTGERKYSHQRRRSRGWSD